MINIRFSNSKAISFILLAIYIFFFYLMYCITIQYIPIKYDAAFLLIKQDYIHLLHYRIAFYIHVFSSVFVLLAGFTQFSTFIRKRFTSVHKKMGWIYITITLFLSGPSGFIIGFYANGGWTSQIAFMILAVLWIVFTAISLYKVLKKDFVSHQIWMLRSFALALSAITLRAWKYILVFCFHPKPMDVYQIVAWLGWTLNLLIAEIIIFKTIKNEKTS